MDYSQKQNRLDIWNNKKKQLAVEAMSNMNIRSNDYVPRQRDVYWVFFGENIGHEITDSITQNSIKRHPGVVVSSDLYNQNGMVVIAPLTSGPVRQGKHLLDCQYLIKSNKYQFLSKDCVLELDQVRSISTARLSSKVGWINSSDWDKIELRIKKVFRL